MRYTENRYSRRYYIEQGYTDDDLSYLSNAGYRTNEKIINYGIEVGEITESEAKFILNENQHDRDMIIRGLERELSIHAKDTLELKDE